MIIGPCQQRFTAGPLAVGRFTESHNLRLQSIASCQRPAPVAPPCYAVGAPPGWLHGAVAVRAGRVARNQRRTMQAKASATGISQDLLIVGPGVLGGYAGKLWRESFPSSRVVAQTNTDGSHERLRKLGLEPRVKADVGAERFPHVLFSAPPSGSTDYPAEVAAAVQLWDGSGTFVFTSSMSVCAAKDGELVDEDCPLVPLGQAPSTDKLLTAEDTVLKAGGNVLRLVGLYHAARGAHMFFMKQGTVARYGGYVVNLLHYEDAARMAVSILRSDGGPAGGTWRSQVFVGCDNHPLTFQEMMDACAASECFPPGVVEFTGAVESSSGVGKRVNNDASRAMLGGWRPRHDSFQAFFAAGGKDCYDSSA